MSVELRASAYLCGWMLLLQWPGGLNNSLACTICSSLPRNVIRSANKISAVTCHFVELMTGQISEIGRRPDPSGLTYTGLVL
jgi:hypothetical protein